MKYFKKIIIFSLIILSLFTSIARADDSSTRSIVGDYFNKVFSIELNDGKGILETKQDAGKRLKINDDIYNGSINKNYSLYDRFGSNLKFIPYFGETKISTMLLDRFYTNFMENDAKLKISPEEIKKLFQESAISNNVVYDGRPNVLSSENIEAGNIDPRVYAYTGISSVGGNASIGNAMLGISNFATTLIGWLSGSKLYETINDIWQTACNSGLANILKHMVKFFLPLALCIFVAIMISKIFKIIKGEMSIKKILIDLTSVAISLGLIFSLMIKPNVFSNTLTRVVTIFDSTLDKFISINSDEVVKSDDSTNIRQATLWKKNVFEPWCYGMFNDKYENLYTQYDTNKNHHKMEQSHDNVKDNWSDGKIKYDSSSLTGDVKIQLGPNNFVRNWAALALSTQSIYHIDAVQDQGKKENSIEQENKDDSKKDVWPRASTTPMNDDIYVDNFRWIDAKLNISPEYHSTEKVIMNYSNSNNYSQNFISAGFKSLFMTLLLIPIAVLTFRKLKCAIKIVSSGFRIVYQSVVNLIMPEKYNVINNFKSLIVPIYDFFWWSMIIFLAITVYSKIAGNNLLYDVVWVICGVWLCKFRPIRTSRQLKSIINNSKTSIKGKINKLAKSKK